MPPVLAYYDVNKPVEIECDSSKDGLGAVLVQEGHVVAYASRSLTDTEKRYAQIEKEMLSVVFSTTRFHRYIFGKDKVVVDNDHKPLEQIFKKSLLSAPMRLQNMMLKLQWYDLELRYRKGKEMFVSDALSRAFIPCKVSEINDIDIEDHISMISVSKSKYEEIQNLTQSELKTLYTVIQEGWPDVRSATLFEASPYWDSRDQLAVLDGIIYKGSRIVIPPSLRDEMLQLIHKSHLGMTKCKQRGREVMYWPNMNSDIENIVRNCALCAEYQNQQASEPLRPTPTPDLPYSRVGSDLFEFESKKYLIIVDYYSKYIDVVELSEITSTSVIRAMKSVFACHEIPQILRTDNGPQYSSVEFKGFCKQYGIEHETSSPHFQSSNGEAERAVQTVKRLWKKAPDRHLALLDYRTTQIPGLQLSPSQLLMGRRPRNILPSSNSVLKPKEHSTETVKRHFDAEKQRQKMYHDQRKGAKELQPLSEGANVRISPLPGSKSWKPGIVVEPSDKPRSYIVRSGNRIYRRNRRHLRSSTDRANSGGKQDQDDSFEAPDSTQVPFSANRDVSVSSGDSRLCEDSGTAAGTNSPFQTRSGAGTTASTSPQFQTTRSGRQVVPPKRLDL